MKQMIEIKLNDNQTGDKSIYKRRARFIERAEEYYRCFCVSNCRCD